MSYRISTHIQGLIFDFDGTIVDSMPIHFLSWKEAFESLGQMFPETFFYTHAGVSLLGVVAKFNQEFGTALDPRLVVERKDAAHLKYLPQTQIVPEVFEIIEENFGLVPMAVATGNSRNLTEPLIRRLNLEKYFQATIYGDDVKNPKPHPECFLMAASRMGITPVACEVFEDGDAGLEGARLAGMKATDIRPWRTK